MDGAVHVEARTTHAHVRDAVESARHQLDERGARGGRLSARLTKQQGRLDVADANDVTPILDDETVLPLVAGRVRLKTGAVRVVHGLLAEILVDETSLAALRERAVDGVVAPHDEVDRGLRRGRRAACADDVLRVARAAESAVARRKAEVLLGVGGGVAVEHRVCLRLVHRLKEGGVLGQAELSGVAVQHREILVNLGAGFEDAASLIDLRGRGLAARDALVERAPVHGRKTRTDDDALARRQVAFLEDGVLKDLVGLREEFGDDRDATVWIGALRPIGERQVVG